MRGMLAATAILVLVASCHLRTVPSKTETHDANVIAVVLGKEITVNEKDNLDRLVLGALLEQYAKDKKIKATDKELDAFLKATESTEEVKQQQEQADLKKRADLLRKELDSPSLSDQERKEEGSRLRAMERMLEAPPPTKEQARESEELGRPMMRQVALQFVKPWKVNKALYAQYGGRVIFQQAGAEPLDAYRKFLKEQEKKGAFRIFDEACEKAFWRYFTDDTMHSFYSEEEGAKFINTPWWTMKQPPEEP